MWVSSMLPHKPSCLACYAEDMLREWVAFNGRAQRREFVLLGLWELRRQEVVSAQVL